ncbi:uncharacterized protein LOC107421387 [Ziziphus jujuba]|uniref:Uncharacterized protein LOC107421387 n=1 Tax=Ziziphus jujuba TaxID=326968 RepID=A0ABM3IM92_ZIZJJ|nr:uncharacterized protein LOC107421387 [Ziziphus jujuba]
MSMLDSFFSKGFKAAKCKTLLKLTIPRIKLLRNRRENQIKQMRRDIAKLLETGQEATARIRVEHIIREENMMAAQEIIELFCELISVRLPIIESQRECPLDLKEAISSVCFAAPRCADLPELLQVQLSFASKYGKEFVAAATELLPDCGVNRQLIELLSIRAPAPEKKMKLLKEIAEEHELDWDPAASENEFLKPHEDLLNGPTQFISGSKQPLPQEKHDEAAYNAPDQTQEEKADSDSDLDSLDFPEVPKVSLRPSPNVASVPAVVPPAPTVPDHDIDHDSSRHSRASGIQSEGLDLEYEEVVKERSAADRDGEPHAAVGGGPEDRQFLPFISPPSQSSVPSLNRQSSAPLPVSRTNSEANVDLQDVLAAAQAAAETAERAAAAARSAASLAQVRISGLTKKNSDTESISENPFHTHTPDPSPTEKPNFDHHDTHGDSAASVSFPQTHEVYEGSQGSESSKFRPLDSFKSDFDASLPDDKVLDSPESARHPPQRLPSMEDDPYFAYPNLFTSQNSNLSSGSRSFTDNKASYNP